jgi:hypothetical protein
MLFDLLLLAHHLSLGPFYSLSLSRKLAVAGVSSCSSKGWGGPNAKQTCDLSGEPLPRPPPSSMHLAQLQANTTGSHELSCAACTKPRWLQATRTPLGQYLSAHYITTQHTQPSCISHNLTQLHIPYYSTINQYRVS